MTTTSPWLTDNFAPVTEEVTAVDLEVTGTLPAELDGRYVRNGPNPRNETDPATYHWFTGDGMVHGVRLRDGRAEWYRNRWVRDDGEFGANTNVISQGGRTWAIVSVPRTHSWRTTSRPTKPVAPRTNAVMTASPAPPACARGAARSPSGPSR